MNKRQVEIIQASRKNEKKFPPSNDKENSSKASNAIQTASLFIIEKKKKIVYDTDEATSTKKRASSPKHTESTSDTKSVSNKSVSTNKKTNEKIQERVVYSNVGRRKYSELKNEDKFKITQKKKVVLQNKKIYRETIKFRDDTTKSLHAFPLYSEKDILNIVFNVELIEQELDNDVETDDDQLKDSKKHVLKSLKEGINEYNEMCK
jgi:hypothetical protein